MVIEMSTLRPKIDARLRMPDMVLNYSTEMCKRRGGYGNLIMVAKQHGVEMSTEAQEVAIEKASLLGVRSSAFEDILHGDRLYQYTATELRVPKDVKPGDYEIHEGEKFYPREIFEYDKHITELLIPEALDGTFRKVSERDTKTGVPVAVEKDSGRAEAYNWYFRFDPKLRSIYITRDANSPFCMGSCMALNISATYDWHSSWDLGDVCFRPVSMTPRKSLIDQLSGIFKNQGD